METLEVFALDEAMNRATGSIPYESLQWNRKYYESGTFTMVVRADVYDESWKYIYTDERPETGMIQKVQAADSDYNSDMTAGVDTVTLSGFFMEEIMNRMVFLVEEIEQEKVIVPKPSVPSITKAQQPTYWQDDAGNLYYKDGHGTFRDSSGKEFDATAHPAGSAELKWHELDYVKPFDQYKEENNPTGIVEPHEMWTTTTYYYKTAEDKKNGTLTVSRTNSDKAETKRVAMSDDKGNALTQWSDGTYHLVFGVVDREEDTYKRQMAAWEAKIEGVDDDGNGYYMKDVMGPWSSLELDDLQKEDDNVRLVTLMARKKMQNLFLYDEPTITGESKKLSDISLSKCGDWMHKELQTVEASFRVFYSFEHNTFVFQTWRGKDRTQSQTENPFAVFSDTWGTLYSYSASRDASNYRNKCYVLYDYEVPNGWKDGKPAADWKFERDTSSSTEKWVRKYYIPFARKRGKEVVRLDDGQPDMEIWLDRRSDKPESDQAWSREEKDSEADLFTADASAKMQAQYEAFEASMRTEGEKLLSNDYSVIENLDTGTLDVSRYLEDFDLGDKVDMVVGSLGMAKEARIIGCSEVHEAGKSTVTLEMGDELISDTKKAVMD